MQPVLLQPNELGPDERQCLAVQLTRLEAEAIRGITLRETLIKKELQAFQSAKAELLGELFKEWGAPEGSDLDVNLEAGTATVKFPKPAQTDA